MMGCCVQKWNIRALHFFFLEKTTILSVPFCYASHTQMRTLFIFFCRVTRTILLPNIMQSTYLM